MQHLAIVERDAEEFGREGGKGRVDLDIVDQQLGEVVVQHQRHAPAGEAQDARARWRGPPQEREQKRLRVGRKQAQRVLQIDTRHGAIQRASCGDKVGRNLAALLDDADVQQAGARVVERAVGPGTQGREPRGDGGEVGALPG